MQLWRTAKKNQLFSFFLYRFQKFTLTLDAAASKILQLTDQGVDFDLPVVVHPIKHLNPRVEMNYRAVLE